MMGLPAVHGQENEDEEPTKERQRSTLFGIPAATNEQQDPEPEGLAESTAPSQVGEETQSEGDGATRVVSDLNLDEVLEEDRGQQGGGGGQRGNKSTAFGIPKADGTPEGKGNPSQGSPSQGNPSQSNKPGGQDVASAWGLDEETSEPQSGATQVAGSALVDAIMESKQGASGFSKTTTEADENIKGTLMGMSRDEFDEDSTQAVNRAELEGLRRKSDFGNFGSASPEDAEPEDEFEATQALAPDKVAQFEENINSDRRRQLLKKLRSKGEPDESAQHQDPKRDTAKGIPAANSQTSSSPQQPLSESQPFNRPQTGPRFSIPTRGEKAGGNTASGEPEHEEVPLEAVEPVEPEPKKPSIGGGSTSFPISTGGKREGQSQQGGSDDDLDLALGDTGVLEPASVEQAGANDAPIREFVDDEQPAGGGIREFTDDDDDAEPIFPIDDSPSPGRRQIDLSAEAAPPAQSPEGQRSTQVDFGPTPPSGAQAPVGGQPVAQQRAPTEPQAHLHQPQQPQQPQQAQQPQQPQQQVDPTVKFVRTVQVLCGLLGALLWIGATGYAFVGGAGGEVVEIALMAAPAAVGLLTLMTAFLPLSASLRSGGFFVMSLLGIGALVGAAMFSAPTELLFLVLVGAVLVLCAAAFPLLLKVVQ